MEYKNYRFDLVDVDQEVENARKNLKANLGLSDIRSYALAIINRRLLKDPKRYLDYGMYWGALKEVLRKSGYEWGDPITSPLTAVYVGETDLQTIIMADAFRNMYLNNFAIGTNSFVLDDNNPEYVTIYDEYMENLVI